MENKNKWQHKDYFIFSLMHVWEVCIYEAIVTVVFLTLLTTIFKLPDALFTVSFRTLKFKFQSFTINRKTHHICPAQLWLKPFFSTISIVIVDSLHFYCTARNLVCRTVTLITRSSSLKRPINQRKTNILFEMIQFTLPSIFSNFLGREIISCVLYRLKKLFHFTNTPSFARHPLIIVIVTVEFFLQNVSIYQELFSTKPFAQRKGLNSLYLMLPHTVFEFSQMEQCAQWMQPPRGG